MIHQHRAPWDCVYAKDDENECQPGKMPSSDQEYFEVLCLCLLQTGLNWGSIRKHWPRYREGFLGFDIGKLSRARAEELIERPGVIKNSRKLEAIIHNAREFEAIGREYGSAHAFLESLKPLTEQEQLRSLAKRFKQVGPETADYFLHSVGFWDNSGHDAGRAVPQGGIN